MVVTINAPGMFIVTFIRLEYALTYYTLEVFKMVLVAKRGDVGTTKGSVTVETKQVQLFEVIILT
jgi:hypothetical protein